MTQSEKASLFKQFHVKGNPIVLYNIWDPGSAQAIAGAGAAAIATGSKPLAAAQGFEDGEKIPLELMLDISKRIAKAVNVPLSVDFEGGYSTDPETIGNNITSLIKTGAIGINFEDQMVGGSGFHPIKAQAERIKAIRKSANEAGLDLFINARTDLFLKEKDQEKHAMLIDEATERAAAYKDAGADCFFAPGLFSSKLITGLCETIELPLNIIMLPGAPNITELASMGVARVSFGPVPHIKAMAMLAETYRASI